MLSCRNSKLVKLLLRFSNFHSSLVDKQRITISPDSSQIKFLSRILTLIYEDYHVFYNVAGHLASLSAPQPVSNQRNSASSDIPDTSPAIA